MYDLVIKNGKIIDGSGNPWFIADVAIAEGMGLPLYAFTYAIEMIQFYHEDPDAFTGTNDEVTLDHSIVARHHA